LRIDLDVEVKISIGGARGDCVVATAVGCGDNPVGTGLELDVATLVDVLLPANIRGVGVLTAASLTRTERGKVRDADSVEPDGPIDITAAGLVSYGNGRGLLNSLTVPIDTHPNPIGGRIGTAVDANQLYLPPHEVGGIEKRCRPHEE
jgi:hypothetical protein